MLVLIDVKLDSLPGLELPLENHGGDLAGDQLVNAALQWSCALSGIGVPVDNVFQDRLIPVQGDVLFQ